MLNVSFVNPPSKNRRKITRNCDCASESKGRYLLQPFDLLYLSARLPKGAKLQFLDAVADELTTGETLLRLKKFAPQIVVSTLADVMWDWDIAFLKALRQELSPQTKLYVLGDALIEPFAREQVADFTDGIVSSPFFSDFTGSELISTRSFTSETPLLSKAPEEVSLGIPRHQDFQNSAYRWPFARFKNYTSVVTAWGCPYKCSYCIDSLFPSLFRPVEEIEQELQLLKKMGIREISITDKSFGIPAKNATAFLNTLIKMGTPFSWSTYLNPLQGDPGFLQLMAEAGCKTIIIGIESQDHAQLKNYNRTSTDKLITNVIANAHKAKIEVCGDFLFGLGFQEKSHIQSNIDYSLGLDLDYASFNIAAPLPGSAIRREALRDGRMNLEDRHFDSVGRGRALSSAHCSSETLIALRNQAVRRFYMRPQYLLKRLKSLQSWEQFLLQIEEMSHLFAKTLRS